MIPLILALAAGPLGQPSPLKPIFYDDCGSPGRQPHVRVGKPWTFGEDQVSAAP